MRVRYSLSALITATIVYFLISGSVTASMLVDDLSKVEVTKFDNRNWEIQHHTKKAIRINCVSCTEQVLVNIELSDRGTFGILGETKAKKAKEQCIEEPDGLLQCDTIKGFEFGEISGLLSTIKIIEGFYITSYILGDRENLIQIRTKANTKDLARIVTFQLFDAIKPEVIKK